MMSIKRRKEENRKRIWAFVPYIAILFLTMLFCGGCGYLGEEEVVQGEEASVQEKVTELMTGEQDDASIRQSVGLSDGTILALLAEQEGNYNFDCLDEEEQLIYVEILQILKERGEEVKTALLKN